MHKNQMNKVFPHSASLHVYSTYVYSTYTYSTQFILNNVLFDMFVDFELRLWRSSCGNLLSGMLTRRQI